MRFLTKHKIFTLLVCIAFLSLSSAAQKKSELNFPDIEGWERSELTTYPLPELGYSVAYQSEAGTMTIYVYNGGNKKIADGVEDKLVKKEIEKAGSDIEAIGKMGRYENVKKIKSDTTVSLGDGKTKALYSLYNFDVRGTTVDSEIYIFGYQNNFIKIRATRPKADDGEENTEIKDFLTQLDKIFSK